MGVQPESSALTTLDRARRQIGLPEDDTSQDAGILSLILAASGLARELTGGQPLRQRAVSWSVAGEGLLEGNGTCELILPAFPVLALTALHVDTRLSPGIADWAWDNTAFVETGAFRYGPDKDFVLDQRRGIITLTNGGRFPEGPYVRVEGVAGLADGVVAIPLPMNAAYPFSAALFGTAADGGKFHPIFGWYSPRGEAISEKVDELVVWMRQQKLRASQGIASISGSGSTVTYLQNIPVEIREFFGQWSRGLA